MKHIKTHFALYLLVCASIYIDRYDYDDVVGVCWWIYLSICIIIMMVVLVFVGDEADDGGHHYHHRQQTPSPTLSWW